MDKKNFYREQAYEFKDYFRKIKGNPIGGLLPVFNEWVETKDFSEADKHAILRKASSLIYRKSARKEFELKPQLHIHFKDDPIALKDIAKLVLLAIELADEENNLDSK